MRQLRHLLIDKSCGVALLEFALILPILLTMLIGTIELARFTIINQKLDKAANAMADFVTQNTTICTGDLASFSQAIPQIMQPFAFDGSVIFSSVTFFSTPVPPCTGNNVICLSWQNTQLGADASHIGAPGGNASLPGAYIVAPGQNVISAEVYLNYTPILDVTGTLIPGLSAQKLYKVAVYKPRQGTLAKLCNS